MQKRLAHNELVGRNCNKRRPPLLVTLLTGMKPPSETEQFLNNNEGRPYL